MDEKSKIVIKTLSLLLLFLISLYWNCIFIMKLYIYYPNSDIGFLYGTASTISIFIIFIINIMIYIDELS